jgi:hypothetical protein
MFIAHLRRSGSSKTWRAAITDSAIWSRASPLSGKSHVGAVPPVESHSTRPIAYQLGPCTSLLFRRSGGSKTWVRTAQHGPLASPLSGKSHVGVVAQVESHPRRHIAYHASYIPRRDIPSVSCDTRPCGLSRSLRVAVGLDRIRCGRMSSRWAVLASPACRVLLVTRCWRLRNSPSRPVHAGSRSSVAVCSIVV